MNEVLEISHIHKSFGGLGILQDVSLTMCAGSAAALFGENGSGKTTLLHVLSGFVRADSGAVRYKGQRLDQKSAVDIATLGVGKVWQTPRVCKNLTVKDNLLLAIKDHPGERPLNYLLRPGLIRATEQTGKIRAQIHSADLGLDRKLEKTAGSLSFGEQKLLSLGMLLMNGADLLLMDEPFAGISPVMVDRISQSLSNLKKKGVTILFVEHNRDKARAIADDIYLLSKGKLNRER